MYHLNISQMDFDLNKYVFEFSVLESYLLLCWFVQKHGRIRTTVKPVLSGHSKIDKTKVLMENGSLMKFESITECSILLTCIKRYSVLKTNFCVLFEWPLKTGFTVLF